MQISLLFPMFPWEGPPLPRLLKIYWPWVIERSRVDFFRGRFDFVSGTQFQETELDLHKSPPSLEIDWSEDGYPTKITQLTRGNS